MASCVAPYSSMQNIVGEVILEERDRLSALAEKHITVHISKALPELITMECDKKSRE